MGWAKPSQSDGFMRALARPNILKSQGRAVKPRLGVSKGLSLWEFTRIFTAWVIVYTLLFPVATSLLTVVGADRPSLWHTIHLSVLSQAFLFAQVHVSCPIPQVFMTAMHWQPSSPTLVALFCLNSHSNHLFCVRNVHCRDHQTTCQGYQCSLSLVVRWCTKGFQRR